jgi:hypothetical protein
MLKRVVQVAVVALIAAFLAVLGRFVFLRFSSGELYPEYSSLRADPFGTKALFESLRGFEKITVVRNVESLQKLHGDSHTTVFFLGLGGLPEESEGMKPFETIARSGARVLISLNAVRSINQEREADRIDRWRPSDKSEKQDRDSHQITPPVRNPIHVRLIDPLRANTNKLDAARVFNISAPARLPWYGRFCFEVHTNDWDTLYEVKGKPVVIQKKTGLGLIVLCADTFLFSNEALARERSAGFLLWATGDANRVVFDETHLGIARGSSIMVVVREYRLQGLFFGLILLAALWVWKNSSNFVPPYEEQTADSGAIEGKTAREGIVHLLEQNLAVDDLPAICLREWSRSHPNPNTFDAARLKEAEAALAQYQQLSKKERHPLEIYQRITDLLAK